MSLAQAYSRYTNWLHTRWPAGTAEKLPEVGESGTTNIPGVYVVGDLTGVPLLKFSAETATKAIQHILQDASFSKSDNNEIVDIAIIGGGVSGISAAIEAAKAKLSYAVFEASETFSTVANFPKGKPIYTYPTDMEPSGGLHFHADVKEKLLEEMEEQRQKHSIEVTRSRIENIKREKGVFSLTRKHESTVKAQRVIVAIGRSGNFRKLGCRGENLDHVYNRLHDPKEFGGKNVVVVGGGDSALEAAVAIACCGGHVTLSYRSKEFTRPKPENIDKVQNLVENPSCDVCVEKPSSERVTTSASSLMRGDNPPGSLTLKMETSVEEITENDVTIKNADGTTETLKCDVVFSMIGREAPLDFFRRSGINITGEWRGSTKVSFVLFFLFCTFLYHWKSSSSWVYNLFKSNNLFPFNVPEFVGSLSSSPYMETIAISMKSPGFYITLAYCIVVTVFGFKRIRRRKTPYVKVQTITLIVIQILPLFLLPEIILPLMGTAGYFDAGWLKSIADQLFPLVNSDGGEHIREYWRAYGFIFAWPLFIYNLMTWNTLWLWFAISMIQTFVFIPLIVWKWGKGAYCGWICSCGALAETLGDTHRHKMPHGPKWNRLNMVGQVILWIAFALLLLRLLSEIPPLWFLKNISMMLVSNSFNISYYYIVDLFLAGIVGIAMYFWFSGRVWCRFACPLAALMHIYARFSKFRIFSEKSKCISCNVCTSVCHQGIDIMNFANKGLPMEDPECVRCSACVQQCPTGTLSFGELGKNGEILKGWLQASPVQMKEK
ncbi:FAD-dependent oxidoreductase [Candidatus Uabimicrobium amorphum]|uniref:Pyridine nucleotide-disulfide oxidoreductase n=1 Tax=Uabimicrobium amorphum TaxID=2596890 RepID=A0A5S9F7C9_UABAM|nr:NAD(P)-binding domain-containing protein [Candidatus Uabimicrobium amorphum]BBM87514.1 pyridine nucleotide-disulfide oxidoreductase [Candidatus Uabimicrobium amorphum]